MTLREATHDLYKKWTSRGYPSWLQSIGEAEVGQYNDEARIVVYLTRRPHSFEVKIPAFWPTQEDGYPVEVHVIGEIRIGPP